jgi:hypothetical protein
MSLYKISKPISSNSAQILQQVTNISDILLFYPTGHLEAHVMFDALFGHFLLKEV